jgi:spore maturation protein CgeB
MRITLFCHSLISDWNHGNAHFLRGIASELLARGHDVAAYEPAGGWSLRNLLTEHGEEAVARFARAFPHLRSIRYDATSLDLDRALDADLVIVHEWSDSLLVSAIGKHNVSRRRCRVLFHDTHHRSVTDESAMAAYDLEHYDGVLAFGEVIRQFYLARGWSRRAWTWHEAADTRVFRPIAIIEKEGDLIWVGNWGDDERTSELREFLLEPIAALGLKARVHGVRYPPHALEALSAAGIEYAGWLPNYEAPRSFAAFRATIHVPRRPYVRALPGIPTIRVFEALACGIPLVSAPWDDAEGLFRPGRDYLVARNGAEMQALLQLVVSDPAAAHQIARSGLETVLSRHTCAHRVNELMSIWNQMEGSGATVLAGANA